jgi:hypothetical protein
MFSNSFALHESDFHKLSLNKPVQMNSEIQSIIQKRDQTKSGINFVFPDEQKKQVSQWKSIKIICENFPILNNNYQF